MKATPNENRLALCLWSFIVLLLAGLIIQSCGSR
jgi:hypothetical protein